MAFIQNWYAWFADLKIIPAEYDSILRGITSSFRALAFVPIVPVLLLVIYDFCLWLWRHAVASPRLSPIKQDANDGAKLISTSTPSEDTPAIKPSEALANDLKEALAGDLKDRPVHDLKDRPVHDLKDRPVHDLKDRPVHDLKDRPVHDLKDMPGIESDETPGSSSNGTPGNDSSEALADDWIPPSTNGLAKIDLSSDKSLEEEKTD